MNGPDHYYAAERYLASADDALEERWEQSFLAVAQVHATLALAAAMAQRAVGLPADGQTAGEWRTAVTR